MVGAAGADLMKPQRKIRNLVKPRATESTLKPTSAYSAEEPWIYVRGCRIERAGLRFRVNSQGELYVPDSEDEEEALEVSANGPVDVDLAPVVAADGAAGVDLPPTVGADAASDIDLPPAVAANGAAGVDLVQAVAANGAASVEMTPEVAASLAKKVLGEDLHREVAALLAAVLSKMEPFYHECFIDMYKVMVPIFFTPTP
jgi:hypothetical protein